jgi:8-oxo-dGTP pyrophosphatase MutT (NUDIX family)
MRRGGAQTIPRPRNFQIGPGAGWSHRPNGDEPITIDAVRAAAARHGGSWVSAHLAFEIELPSADPRPAAVLCALFDEGGLAHIVLTRRSARLRSHTGEVSFPGGRLDPGETPLAAALREADEEVGIDPDTVEIIGHLSTLSTMANPAPILPYLGVLRARPQLRPNPAEVERAFTVSLSELASSEVYHEELWRGPDGTERSMSFFELDGDTVWGATARMLDELLDWVLVER